MDCKIKQGEGSLVVEPMGGRRSERQEWAVKLCEALTAEGFRCMTREGVVAAAVPAGMRVQEAAVNVADMLGKLP